MFPVSFVSSQINSHACYLVLRHSFSWSSIIVIETREPKKKKRLENQNQLMGYSDSMTESVTWQVLL